MRSARCFVRRTARLFTGRNARREFSACGQRIKYSFENFIHKNKGWDRLSDSDKSEYKALHDEFIRTSAAMLREFEKNGGAELEKEIERYVKGADSKRATLEGKRHN